MRIAIAQIDNTVGDLRGNRALILEAIRRAETECAELLILPEMALCGYPARDLLERDDFVGHTLEALEQVARACTKVAALVGHVDFNRGGGGRRLHNSVSLLGEGRRLATVHKTLLPTYDVFDEARFFEPAPARELLTIGGHRIAVTICEDLWAMHGLPEQRPYGSDPLEELLAGQPELILNLSASPFSLGKLADRLTVVREHLRRARVPLIYCNQVGANDGVIFDGSSLAFRGDGTLVRQLAPFAPDFAVVDLELGPAREFHEQPAPVTLPGEEEQAHAALCLGIRDYLGKTGFRDVVIGLSGGVDSALVAVLAVDALGAEHVLGVSMPSVISSQHSRTDAQALAANLGIRLLELPIAAVVSTYEQLLGPVFSGLEPDVTEENLQARVRGNLLMALSNKLGHLVLSTGNKSEVAVGYCTLYGDMCGGLSVLGDVPKTLVYRIAQWCNRDRVRIPINTLDKPPSAELRPGQVDQDSLPPYDLLDAIVRGYVEEHAPVTRLLERGLPEPIVRRVIGLIDRQEYKRQQTAPVLRISNRAFGTGRRYPIVQRYDPFSGAGS